MQEAYDDLIKSRADERRLAEEADAREEDRVQSERFEAEEIADRLQIGGPNPTVSIYAPDGEKTSYSVTYDFTRKKAARGVGSRGDIRYGTMLPPPHHKMGGALHVDDASMLFLPLPKINEGPIGKEKYTQINSHNTNSCPLTSNPNTNPNLNPNPDSSLTPPVVSRVLPYLWTILQMRTPTLCKTCYNTSIPRLICV